MTIKVEKYYDHAEAQKDLRSYHADINVDLMRQSGLFAFWNAKLVRAEAQYERLCNALDMAEAKVDAELRADASASGGKITETQIKSKLAADRRLHEVRLLVIEAKQEMGFLKGTCDALRQKKDMLMQLAMNMREEFKGSPTIMGNTNKENRHERLKHLTASDPYISTNT